MVEIEEKAEFLGFLFSSKCFGFSLLYCFLKSWIWMDEK
jgi:hypothetical protein